MRRTLNTSAELQEAIAEWRAGHDGFTPDEVVQALLEEYEFGPELTGKLVKDVLAIKATEWLEQRWEAIEAQELNSPSRSVEELRDRLAEHDLVGEDASPAEVQAVVDRRLTDSRDMEAEWGSRIDAMKLAAKLMEEFGAETVGDLPPEALDRVAFAIGEAVVVPDDDEP